MYTLEIFLYLPNFVYNYVKKGSGHRNFVYTLYT